MAGISGNRAAAAHQTPSGFDFTNHARRLCSDIVTRMPEFSHVDIEQVAFSFSQTRKRVRHGLWAALTPMRFEHGALVTTRHGKRYTVQRLRDTAGREMLYILSFYLPRFMQLDFEDKLNTIFHELWHIGPDFNGDIRRHPGRCYAHTHSQHEYDQAMAELAQRWLAAGPQAELYRFLQMTFGQLEKQFGFVHGVKIRHPKLIPLDA